MKKLNVIWKGLSPLLMHSCQGVNPLHPITKELKKYTSKRIKTDDDIQTISDLEWQSGLYWRDEIGGLYMPAENIEATLRNGAKANKKGKDIEKYVNVEGLYCDFEYGENLTKDQLLADLRYRDVRPMNVNNSKIMRTRPRFDTWQTSFILTYNEEKIDLEVIVQAMEIAGLYVGLCDSRPKYGKFTAIVEELD